MEGWVLVGVVEGLGGYSLEIIPWIYSLGLVGRKALGREATGHGTIG